MQVAASGELQGLACGARRAQAMHHEVRCHSTQGQLVQQEVPDISCLEPALQQQWDHAANAHLGPIDIKPHSCKKVWWICDQCPDGHLHRWEATVANKSKGKACPQCCGRKVCKHNSLATKAPSVAAQWDFEANNGTPDSVVAQSGQHVAWLCDACGTGGAQHPITGSARKLTAQNAVIMPRGIGRSHTQPLQTVRTPEAKLFWQNGTMNAMHLRGTFPTTPG